MHLDGQKRIIKPIKSLFEWCVDQCFPWRCPICDEILEPELVRDKIHPSCKEKLYPVRGAVCMQCGRPLENSTREYCYDCTREESAIWQGKALYLYQGAIKQTMYRFKYSNKQEYAQFFAEYAIEKYGEWIREKEIDAIVPVPMYRKKQKKRGYNQAESFAKALSSLTGIPVANNLISRVVDTAPQKELNDIERKKNLKSAFQNCKNVVQYKHILVVDDIYTTGSTIRAVTEKLKAVQTDKIYVLCICIGKGM